MTDVVYALGSGSAHNDMELMFSLRSVAKHLKDYRHIYIVGERPDFVQWTTAYMGVEHGIYHLPAKDDAQKQENIKNKILLACSIPDLTDTFLFINDDHILLKDIPADKVPYWHKGWLADSVSRRLMREDGTEYTRTLQNTLRAMEHESYGKMKPVREPMNFDVHTPILYSKECFIELANYYANTNLPAHWGSPGSLAIKSLYCNTFDFTGVRRKDCLINKDSPEYQLQAFFVFQDMISIGENGFSPALINSLHRLFPEKSIYEK